MTQRDSKMTMLYSSVKKDIKKVAEEIVKESETYQDALSKVKMFGFYQVSDTTSEFCIDAVSAEIRRMALEKKTENK